MNLHPRHPVEALKTLKRYNGRRITQHVSRITLQSFTPPWTR